MRRSRLQSRRQLRSLLAEVQIPDPWDVQEFCDRLAARRGRPLQLLAVPAVDGAEQVCGAWVPLPEGDVIFVKLHTSSWHRDWIVLHECAHMLCGHQPTLRAVAGWVRQLLPAQHWDAEVVAGILMRDRYDSPIEREAEVLAGMIESRVQRRPTSPAPLGNPSASADVVEVLGRFARALGVPEP